MDLLEPFLPNCLPFLTCNSPDVAFHVVLLKTACEPEQVVLSTEKTPVKKLSQTYRGGL